MSTPAKLQWPIAITLSLAAIVQSSCALDDFVEERRQQALRSELQALGEKCVRINADYLTTSKCIVVAGYVVAFSPFDSPLQPGEKEITTFVKRCLGKSCGLLSISVDTFSRAVTKWKVEVFAPPEPRMM